MDFTNSQPTPTHAGGDHIMYWFVATFMVLRIK